MNESPGMGALASVGKETVRWNHLVHEGQMGECSDGRGEEKRCYGGHLKLELRINQL
jgi:hypothetical protein